MRVKLVLLEIYHSNHHNTTQFEWSQRTQSSCDNRIFDWAANSTRLQSHTPWYT